MTEETGMARWGGDGRDLPCDYYYHLETFAQLKVYLYARKVTSGGKDGREFSAPDKTTAKETGLCLESTRVARRGLARDGWLILLRPSQGPESEPNRYAFVGHDAWIQGHPGRCFQDERSG